MPSPLPHAAGPITGEVLVPGSKSETNRALVLAALAEGPSVVRGALTSRDSALMIGALRALGVGIETDGDALRVTPPRRFSGAASIDCGLAGTVMRFVPPLTLLADDSCSFTGDPHASQRPMAALLDALRRLGARVDGDALPFTVHPASPPAPATTVDASASSQFVSGLLLVAPRLPQGLRLSHVGERLPSRPHIAMTVEMLRSRGVLVDEPDDRTWVVSPGPIAPSDTPIEPDLTNASVFLAAALVAGGSVTVPGWPRHSLQPGALFLDVAKRMGGEISRSGDRVTVSGDGRLKGIDIDLTEASELTPVVAALGAIATGVTTIGGVGHIRGHETDRLAALTAELQAVGVDAAQSPDGLRIVGGAHLKPTVLRAYADHRMVHAAALLALRGPGFNIDDMGCVSKTMPHFARDWTELVTG